MREFGSVKLAGLIYKVVVNCFFSVVVNGELCEYFKFTAGICQADASYPLFSIIAEEVLSRGIRKKVFVCCQNHHPAGYQLHSYDCSMEEVFRHCCSVIWDHQINGLHCPKVVSIWPVDWPSIVSFSHRHLAQLKYILPKAISIKKILVHDERTLCMKPELQINLQLDAFENGGNRKSGSGYAFLRKMIRARLLDFCNAHPEAVKKLLRNCMHDIQVIHTKLSKSEDVLTLWERDTNVLVAVIGDTLTKDFEERSNYYDTLLVAESRAINGKKGIHSAKDPPVMHVTDLLTASAKKAKDFLPFLQQSKRLPAVVDYVLSGHRFKLLIPEETCSIPFSFSGVRCPGRDEPFSDEAIAFMRRKILQRDVEIEVETVDRTGTFLGSLWESKTNMAVVLLESGLARLQTAFGVDRIPDSHLLAKAEQSAKNQRLKIWENHVEGQEATNGSSVAETKQKEVLKVVVTEVLGSGKFYVQTVGDQKVAIIQQQLASLTLQDPPVIGAFNPKKGDIVLAQFSADNSWNRAMVRLSLTTKSGSFYVLEKLVAITSCQ
ncbi:ribonuclease TUDOR 1-like [Magnolia sinica]|uniref:ribonuclease TUDOR 1-like n=1 Tax=Magnolia sinica TaxID=86752 RepID=UPI002659B755|nr:ribonuclease TUDOR 1-like [Magnolia sinica]